MLNEIYNKRILQFAAEIPFTERLEDADATAAKVSRLCGSKVIVDLKMDGDVVTGFGHDVKACALGQASSSIMARNIIGSKASELCALREQMHAMLKDNGPAPDGKWKDLEILEPVRDYKPRHASTLLTFDAVCDAIEQIHRDCCDTEECVAS
jgi:NifU-like protein involved in Fe-S cluster formation